LNTLITVFGGIIFFLLGVIGTLTGIIIRHVNKRIGRLEGKFNAILMVLVSMMKRDDVNGDMLKTLTDVMKE